MDIKKMVDKLVDKIQKDPSLLADFKEKPVPVIEKLVGIDLPDAEIEKLAELIKAKIDLEKAADLIGNFSSLFGKK